MAKKSKRPSTIKAVCSKCHSNVNFTWMDGKTYRCPVCGNLVKLMNSNESL